MIYLNFEDLRGNKAKYITVDIDWYETENFLSDTHYHILHHAHIPNIVGYSEYSRNNQNVEIIYKGLETESSIRGKSIFKNNIEGTLIRNVIGILSSNVKDSSGIVNYASTYQIEFFDSFIDKMYFIKNEFEDPTLVHYDEIDNQADYYDILRSTVTEYIEYLHGVLLGLKRTEILSNFEVEVNFTTSDNSPSGDIRDLPSTSVLCMYYGLDIETSTDKNNMFIENEEDYFIDFIFRYKYFVPKEYYDIVREGNRYTYKEKRNGN